jgi:stearoyl-CoA desaturase (delta-9 desaturase)
MFDDLPVWLLACITLAMTQVSIAAVTIYLHRCQAHRALELHPIVSHFFRAWLWLTTGMVTREWVAVHRKHHAHVESGADPHSPRVLGLRRVLWQGTELYRASAADNRTLADYGHETPDDWIERNLYQRHSHAGIALMLMIDVVLFGPLGLTVWAVQMAWMPLFAAGVINGLGHHFGYRNFEPADASTNIVPLGLFIGGEELHNNHHAYASSARFASRWYEIDIGWIWIRLLENLRLARVRKLAPTLRIDRSKQHVDLETLRAVIGSRMHVMSHYARDVIGAVYRDERERCNRAARRLLRRGRRLLVRHESLIDTRARQRLDEILHRHRTLEVVYQFRRRLQDLWAQRSASHEHLLGELQEWCRQAEQTGIAALQSFAHSLRGYTLAPA